MTTPDMLSHIAHPAAHVAILATFAANVAIRLATLAVFAAILATFAAHWQWHARQLPLNSRFERKTPLYTIKKRQKRQC